MLMTPASGHAAQTSVGCTKHITVVFMFYGGELGDRSHNGCWSYYRPINDAGTFVTCRSSDGYLYGSGAVSEFIFDDTNPTHALTGTYGGNTQLSNHCGVPTGLSNYGEFMAARNAPWCVNPAQLPSPCWRHNDAGGTFSHYFAELYSDGSHGYDLRGNWTSCSPYYGAC